MELSPQSFSVNACFVTYTQKTEASRRTVGNP